MSSRRPLSRSLGPEEKALWGKVTATVKRLPRNGVQRSAPPEPDVAVQEHDDKFSRPSARGATPSLAKGAKPAQPKAPSLPQDRSGERRVQRGRVPVEARLDLHGFYADEALRTLKGFLKEAQRSQKRCVLVITGKGGYGSDGEYTGVLHRSLPFWLERGDLSHIVSGYSLAHQRHGGAGAWYIFLRRKPAGPRAFRR